MKADPASADNANRVLTENRGLGYERSFHPRPARNPHPPCGFGRAGRGPGPEAARTRVQRGRRRGTRPATGKPSPGEAFPAPGCLVSDHDAPLADLQHHWGEAYNIMVTA